MHPIRTHLIGLVVAGASLGALAQTPSEHEKHLAESAAASASASKASAPQSGAQGTDHAQMAGMDQHMKAMQALHEKMAAAKTPAQRDALMAEHLKLMQDGMAMMKKMGAGMKGMGGKDASQDPGARLQALEKRMDMVESMMQMLVDRVPSAK